jgi:hypothetical protein
MRIRNHERVIEPDNPSEIDLMPHTEAFTDFPQFRTGGRTETAHQPITAEPPSIRYPALPAPAATTQPLEDPGQLCGD